MIKRKLKMTIPQYRERKEIFESIGYKETSYIEKGRYCIITQEIDENAPHYHELRQYEKELYQTGPAFAPIIFLVIIAFALLSTFVIILADQKKDFDLVTNALSFLLPAFICMFLDVLYTHYYFSVNRKIIDRGRPNKEQVLQALKEIKKE